jgi:hypothetical protein
MGIMTEKLTEQQISYHLANPDKCPCCCSVFIKMGKIMVGENGSMHQEAGCYVCHKKWKVIYKAVVVKAMAGEL